MRYFDAYGDDDDGLSEALSEVDTDLDSWEEAFGEARRPPTYRPRYSPNRRGGQLSTRPRPMPRPVAGLSNMGLDTPAGKMQIRLPEPVATEGSVNNLAQGLRNEVSRVGEAVNTVDRRLDRDIGTLDKKITAVDANLKKGLQQAQQMTLLSLLLTRSPQIEKIKVADVPVRVTQDESHNVVDAKITSGTEMAIQTTTFKKEDNLTLLIALMAMSGGMGNGTGYSANMMLMLLALSGGLGGGTGSTGDSTNTLLLVLALSGAFGGGNK